MPEIKRRTKTEPPADTAAPPPPRQDRVTLTKDVSSRYRKLVPRARATRADGSPPSRPPRSKGAATRPEQASRPPRRNSPEQTPRPPRWSSPEQAPRPSRRNSPEHPPRPPRWNSPDVRPPGPLKILIQRELPEMARQLRETQNLLLVTAKEILALLEDWARRMPEETLVTVLVEKMSFQDLADQRLAKVENFLKALDEITRPTASAGRFPPRRDKPFSKTGPQAGGSKYSPPRRDKPFSKAGPAGGSKPGRPRRDRPPYAGGLKGPQAAGGGLDHNEVEGLLTDLVRQGPKRPRRPPRRRTP